jgi:perosamine synthetase
MPEEIPLARPEIDAADIAAVTEVLQSGRLSLGPRLAEFERSLAAYCETRGAVGVSSGTAGLVLALEALGIGPGDEVITPSFTFVATANAVRLVGATPVFADIDPDTLDLCPASVGNALGPRSRALLAVHVFGRPAPMRALGQIAADAGLRVVEDACEALGARSSGRPAGALGDVGVFGFYPNKIITTGEGGMIVSDDETILSDCRRGRNHGRDAGGDAFVSQRPGHNFRLSEINAALGTSQLGRLDERVAARNRLARDYDERLRGLPSLEVPAPVGAEDQPAWFVYVVRVAGGASRRDAVRRRLAAAGIATGHYFPAIHRLPPYAGERGCRHGPLTVTERISDEALALPFYPGLGASDLDRIRDALGAALAAS